MNADGMALLKEYEGCKLKAYIPVPGDVPTIGYGHTDGVKMGDSITTQKAVALLKSDVAAFEAQVVGKCVRSPNENQLAGMTALAFNVGLGNFSKSTVLKQHNLGNEQACARAFGLFNKAGGVVMAGLTRRRASEAALYLKPAPESQADHPMPQTVDAESSLAKSPIGIGGAITTATGLLTGAQGLLGNASSTSETINDAADKVTTTVTTAHSVVGWLHSATDWFGVTPLEAGGIVLAVAGALIVYFRWKQRSGGFA